MAINLYIRQPCHTLSKAISMSNNVAAILCCMLYLFMMFPKTFINWTVVKWSGMNSCFSCLIFPMIEILRLVEISFSKVSPILLSIKIVSWLHGNFKSFSGFGNNIKAVSFQTNGKYPSLRHLFSIRFNMMIIFLLQCSKVQLHITSEPDTYWLGFILNVPDFFGCNENYFIVKYVVLKVYGFMYYLVYPALREEFWIS